MTVEEKRAKLLAMQKDFAKKYGDKKSIRLGTEVENVQPMSTGILGLDLALGKPMPRGRLVSIAGTESSCKTTTALTTIATTNVTNAQTEVNSAIQQFLSVNGMPELLQKKGINITVGCYEIICSKPTFGC